MICWRDSSFQQPLADKRPADVDWRVEGTFQVCSIYKHIYVMCGGRWLTPDYLLTCSLSPSRSRGHHVSLVLRQSLAANEAFGQEV